MEPSLPAPLTQCAFLGHKELATHGASHWYANEAGFYQAYRQGYSWAGTDMLGK